MVRFKSEPCVGHVSQSCARHIWSLLVTPLAEITRQNITFFKHAYIHSLANLKQVIWIGESSFFFNSHFLRFCQASMLHRPLSGNQWESVGITFAYGLSFDPYGHADAARPGHENRKEKGKRTAKEAKHFKKLLRDPSAISLPSLDQRGGSKKIQKPLDQTSQAKRPPVSVLWPCRSRRCASAGPRPLRR